jgi:hypothetical protein
MTDDVSTPAKRPAQFKDDPTVAETIARMH